MTTATRVTGPNSTTPEATDSHASPHYDKGGSLVNLIGPGTLDDPRIAAREAQYGNRQEEIESILSIDQAAFDRVRALERHLVSRAENFVADVMGTTEGIGTSHTRRPGLVDRTEDIVTELNDLVTQLERGAAASDLAERFVALRNQAMHEALPKLSRAMLEADTHIPKMQDPYGEVQRVIAKMPHSSFRPIVLEKRR